jgi:hypothetical protein
VSVVLFIDVEKLSIVKRSGFTELFAFRPVRHEALVPFQPACSIGIDDGLNIWDKPTRIWGVYKLLSHFNEIIQTSDNIHTESG